MRCPRGPKLSHVTKSEVCGPREAPAKDYYSTPKETAQDAQGIHSPGTRAIGRENSPAPASCPTKAPSSVGSSDSSGFGDSSCPSEWSDSLESSCGLTGKGRGQVTRDNDAY